MEPQKGYLRRIVFIVFEMWLATFFTLLVLFALVSIGRSLDMLEKSYYTEIVVASPGDSMISQDSAEREKTWDRDSQVELQPESIAGCLGPITGPGRMVPACNERTFNKIAIAGHSNVLEPVETEKCSGIQSGIQTQFADLVQLLPKVATDDRTVIITSVNEAFARPNSLLSLFRESFQVGEGIGHLLNNVLVVAVDAMAYSYCKAVHPHCYLLEVKTMDLSSANNYMTDAYIELVWTKLSLQQRVLELGYNFLFTDVDIMCVFSGDADNLDNWPNTGFFYLKATNRTVEMMRWWSAARARFPPNHEQAVFNEIKHELAGDLGTRARFHDTAHFGGFCRIFHIDMAAACTMHANCCFGLGNKLHDLRDVLAQWKNYTGLTPQEKKSQKFTWKDPAKCGTTDKRDT